MKRVDVDVNKIIELYNSGLSQRQIAKIINTTQTVIKDRLKEINFICRKAVDTKTKYYYNSSYFEKIDSEDKAYFLGLLYADGSVSNSNSRVGVTLCLQETDKHILEKFKECLNLNKSLVLRRKKKITHQNSYCLNFYGKKIVEDLINLGCFPAKSLILKFPTEEQVPKHLIHHFMRGYFDGDGCIFKTKTAKGEKQCFSIVGTELFVNSFKNILNKSLNVELSKVRKYKNVFVLATGNKTTLSLLRNFLYNEATIYLKRKYDKFFSLDLSYFVFNNAKICSIEGCINNIKSSNLCSKHFTQEYRKTHFRKMINNKMYYSKDINFLKELVLS